VDSVVVTVPQRGWRGRSLGQPGWLRGSTDSATVPGVGECTADGDRTGGGAGGLGPMQEMGAGSAVMADPAAGEDNNE
jgi:hypothetical protein